MMPGPSPKPRATNQNASFGSTNGVQAAARYTRNRKQSAKQSFNLLSKIEV